MKGGYRAGAGRPRGSRTVRQPVASIVAPGTDPILPLDYMLAVLNDPKADVTRRDRAAIALLPYLHERGVPQPIGKKARAQQAAASAGGPDSDWGDDLDPWKGVSRHVDLSDYRKRQ